MNDPFSRNEQALTDALLQIDQAIGIAEANIAVAQQIGLPEAPDLAMRLPYLVDRARRFLAGVPDFSQPQRWGEARRLLEQARAFGPFFAPYLALGQRITAYRQALIDQEARRKATEEAALQARAKQDADQAAALARRRLSMLRQTVADMHVQRGSGFDNPAWNEALRAVSSILSAQDVRFAAAMASMREGDFSAAHALLDQTLGELQAGLDIAERARVAAVGHARASQLQASVAARLTDAATPAPVAFAPQPVRQATTLLLIEARSGTVFRLDSRPAVVGRGLDAQTPPADVYIDLSRACEPGEAEELGISRRHAEISGQTGRFTIRDVGSTNGTRLRRSGMHDWSMLDANRWVELADADTLQFGLLACTVAIS